MDYSEYVQSEAPKRFQLHLQFGDEASSGVPRMEMHTENTEIIS